MGEKVSQRGQRIIISKQKEKQRRREGARPFPPS
jgi:hypothetical protein